jgi:hypothetical protein
MMNPLESVASWADDEPSLCPGPKLVPLCATFDVESFIERHGLKVRRRGGWAGGEKWELETCPINAEHTGGCSVITRGSSGALGFRCQHNSCLGIGWKELRERLEPGYRKDGRQNDGVGRDDQHGSCFERIEDLPPVCGAQEEICYVRNPELPEGCIIALTGDSGSGKSSLATAWVRDAIANGRHCLILDRENPRRVAIDRMERLNLCDGLLLRWWGGWLGEVPGPAFAMIFEWVQSCDIKPLIVIDTLVAFAECDENDAAQMRKFMSVLRRLADIGATVVVIHHDGKSETARDYRGSSDFKASVDQAFHVSNIGVDGKLDRLTLRCFKSRIGFSGLIVYQYAGGKFVRDERHDAPARSVADQLTDLLRQNPGIRTKGFEDAAVKKGLGRNNARDFLSNSVLSGAVRREDLGRNRFSHYLLKAGKDA